MEALLLGTDLLLQKTYIFFERGGQCGGAAHPLSVFGTHYSISKVVSELHSQLTHGVDISTCIAEQHYKSTPNFADN